MKRKWKDAGGFTLVELLCVVVILMLLGLLLNTGLQMALKSYHDLTAQAEAELLLSTAADALADDLRYARNVRTGADGAALDSYWSDSFGPNARLTLVGGEILAGGKRLLPSGVYGNGRYAVTELEVTFESPCFTVRLCAGEAGGSVLAQTEFTVRCLNAPSGG